MAEGASLLFFVLAIISILVFIVGMIKPEQLKNKETGVTPTRKEISFNFLPAFFLFWLFSNIVEPNDTDKLKNEAAEAEANAACKLDLQCWGDKHDILAASHCQNDIEKLANYTFRWTDGALEPKFSQFRWHNKEDGSITYIGNKIEFQNGFGAYQPYIYECIFNPESSTVIGLTAKPGRL